MKTRNILTILAAIVALACASTASAANRYSVATGLWNATTTWSATSGGTSGASAPTASDDVFIEGGFTVTEATTSAAAASLSVASGSTLIMGNSTTARTLTVGGGVTIAGTIQPTTAGGAHNLVIGGSLINNGTFTRVNGSGTINVTLNGTGAQSIGGTVTTAFGPLTINKSAGTATLGNDISATTFTLTAGTFDPTSAYKLTTSSTVTLTAGTLRVGATTWADNYSFTPTPPASFTIEYYNANPTINAGITYQNLTFTGSGTAGASAALIIQGDLSNTGGGTLDFGANNVTLSGTVAANNIAGFTTTGTVSMTKTAGTATFAGNVNGGALTINGTSGTLNLGTSLSHQINGAVTLTAGTLNGSSSSLGLTGNWSNNGGTFTTPSSSTVTFNNTAAAQAINGSAASQTFNNVAVAKSAQTLSVGGSTGTLTLNGDLTLTSGTFAAGTATTISVAGDWANNSSVSAFTAGSGTVSFTGASKTIGGSFSTTFAGLSIASGATVTLNNDTTCGSLTFAAAAAASSLTQSGTSQLTVNGVVTLNQPSAASVTTAWNINAGTATVSGLITLAGTSTGATRIGTIVITTGTLNANGGMTFAGSAAATKVINMSGGAGNLNLKGALTVPAASSTLTAGTAGSVFNYADTANQTVNFFSAGGYHNLNINNSGASGATLNAAITTANVTGDLRVQTGTLNNGGFAIAGNAGKTFEVASGATFGLTGTSGMATGFGTKTFGATSMVNYAGAAQTVSAETYGHLTVGGTSTKTLAGVVVVAGDLNVSAGTLDLSTFTANHSGSGGTFTVANGATLLVGGAANFPANYDTVSLGGTSTVNYDSTGDQAVPVQTYGDLTISGSGTKTLAGTVGVARNLNVSAGTLDVSTFAADNTTAAGTLTVANGATLKIGGTGTLPTNYSTYTIIATSTVEYYGSGQSVGPISSYGHLTLSGSGTKTLQTGTTTIAGNLTLSGTVNATTAANLAVGGNLGVGSGTAFTVAANFTLGVTGTTTVSGTLTLAGTGNKTFTGNVTINNGGTWDETGVAAYSFAGNLQNDGTLTANTGTHTFAGASKTFSGANPIAIPTVSISGSYVNNATLTVSTALGGAGSLTQGASASAILNLGGTFGITTLAASGSGNTVNYTGTGQTLKVITYHHLILSGGAETFGAITTVNGNLTLSGSATATTGANLAVGGNLSVGDGTTLATASTFTLAVTGTTTVGAGTSGTLMLAGTGAKTFTGNVTIDANGTWNNSGNANVSVKGNFQNNGTFTAGTGTYTFNGSAAQTIGGSAAIAFGGLTINNSAGVALNASVTVNGLLTLTSGDIATGANQVMLAAAATVSGGSATSHVNGTLQKAFASGNGLSFTFPIGDGLVYAPVAFSSMNVSVAGSVAAKTTAGQHPSVSTSGINSAKDVNRYWTLTPSGIAVTANTATFTFVVGDVIGGANTAGFVAARYSGSAWSGTTVSARAATSTTVTGLTDFGSFAIGENAIDHYAVTFSSPNNAGVSFTTTVTAQDLIGQTVLGNSTTVVTNTGTGSVQFDANSDNVYGDNTKTLTAGVATFQTKDDVAETVTITATDANLKTGSAAVTISTVVGAYQSHQSGDWASLSTWERWDGSSWVTPVSSAPATTDGVVTILNGHTVTVAASVSSDQVIVRAGGQVTVSSGVTWTIANGAAATDLDVYGTVNNAGTMTMTGAGCFQSGGKYQHNFTMTAGAIPGATWAADSTCEIIGYTSNTATPSGIQSFGNFTWNCPGQSGTISLAANLTTVRGNLTMANTGSGTVQLATSTGPTVNISGDLIVSGGTLVVSTTGGPTLNVAGSVDLSGGTLQATGTGNPLFNVSGDWSNNGGTFAPGTGRVAFNGTGAQQINGTAASQAFYNVILNKTAGTTLSVGGSTTLLTVNNLTETTGDFTAPATLDINGILTLSAGTFTAGANTTIAGNWVQVAAATFTPGSGTVTFDGTTAQTIGTAASLTFNNVAVNKSLGLTMSTTATLTVNNLTMTAGTFTPPATFNINGSATLNGGTLTAGTAINVAGDWSKNAGTFTPGTFTVTFNGTSAQSLAGATTFYNLTVNNTGAGLTLSADQTVNAALSLTAGKITTGANSIIVGSGGSRARTSGWIFGNEQKVFSADGSFTFDIGDSAAYEPLAVTNLNVTGTTTLKASATSGNHPQLGTAGINSIGDVAQYWTLQLVAGTVVSYGGTFTYPSGESSGTPSAYLVKVWNGSAWSSATVNGTPTSATTSFSGQSGFGDFAIGNVGPVANADSVSRHKNISLKILKSDLTGNDTGTSVSFDSVTSPSANGATLTASGSYVFYTPANNINPDTFTYTIVDGNGAKANGTVTVTITPDYGTLEISYAGAGTVTLSFYGIPDYNYYIQRKCLGDADFSDVYGPITTPADGLIQQNDTPPTGCVPALYRMRAE